MAQSESRFPLPVTRVSIAGLNGNPFLLQETHYAISALTSSGYSGSETRKSDVGFDSETRIGLDVPRYRQALGLTGSLSLIMMFGSNIKSSEIYLVEFSLRQSATVESRSTESEHMAMIRHQLEKSTADQHWRYLCKAVLPLIAHLAAPVQEESNSDDL
jgi:hypothetical protein